MRFARPSAADLASFLAMSRIDQALDLLLDLVGELVAVGSEQLDAVVVVGIVRGRDHHPDIGPHRPRQHRDRRRRHWPEQQHVETDRGEPGDKRRLDHIAGEPRVLADHHPVTMLAAAKHQARRLADPQSEVRRDHAVCPAANAICAEILVRHGALTMCDEKYAPAQRAGFAEHCTAFLAEKRNLPPVKAALRIILLD